MFRKLKSSLGRHSQPADASTLVAPPPGPAAYSTAPVAAPVLTTAPPAPPPQFQPSHVQPTYFQPAQIQPTQIQPAQIQPAPHHGAWGPQFPVVAPSVATVNSKAHSFQVVVDESV